VREEEEKRLKEERGVSRHLNRVSFSKQGKGGGKERATERMPYENEVKTEQVVV